MAVEDAAAATPPRLVHGAVAQRRSAPTARPIECATRCHLVRMPTRKHRHYHRRAPVDQQRIPESPAQDA